MIINSGNWYKFRENFEYWTWNEQFNQKEKKHWISVRARTNWIHLNSILQWRIMSTIHSVHGPLSSNTHTLTYADAHMHIDTTSQNDQIKKKREKSRDEMRQQNEKNAHTNRPTLRHFSCMNMHTQNWNSPLPNTKAAFLYFSDIGRHFNCATVCVWFLSSSLT